MWDEMTVYGEVYVNSLTYIDLAALSQNIRMIMLRGEVNNKMYEYDDDELLLLIFLSTKKFRFIVD